MTQTNTQSVRNDAEAAVTTNRVPTFEEVYAMPYVQESIRALIDQNVRQYPVLASHEDDLRQEMLISLWKELPHYNPEKASLRTFLRMVLRSSIAVARREYFSETNLSLAYADDISNYEICDEKSTVSSENRQLMMQFASESMDREILRLDIDTFLKTLSPRLRQFAERIMDGESLSEIGRDLGVNHSTVRWNYLFPLRRAFKKFF